MMLFGTDGVRGIANKILTPELALKLGRAGAAVLARKEGRSRLVIGRDTRISGPMLEGALVAGICSAGVDVLQAGVLPTPAIAHLTRALGADGGVVISASHNPVEDNGIKFFGPGGYKLPDELEREIENLVAGDANPPAPTGGEVGSVREVANAAGKYVEFLKSAVDTDLSGLKVVLDCANGAACQVAPQALKEMGAGVIPIFSEPNGVNINDACGSTHPRGLQEAVLKHGAHAGLAFDGDADRVIAVDDQGQLVDGDRIMLICARHLQPAGKLAQNTVVLTVMSNMGLRLALQESGIKILETQVGDRYVLEEMIRCGACLGGEQSGHIIFLDHNTTGDGLLTALYLLKVLQKSGLSMSELAAQMERIPQILENVRVENKEEIMGSPVLMAAIKKAEAVLKGRGRILVRPSGTEPLIRVMGEAKDMQQLRSIIDGLVQVVQGL